MTVSANLRAWMSRWFPRWTPSALSVWGKLPTHADYLRHEASAEAALGWQAWLGRYAPLAQRPQSTAWLHLDIEPPDLRAVPVGFVLPPGVLPFSGRRYVAGVIADSVDSAGRAHPLIIWRCVDAQWLTANARLSGLPWWHAQAQLLERLSLLAVADQDDPNSGVTERSSGIPVWDWGRLCGLASQLDAASPETATLLQTWLARRLPLPMTAVVNDQPPLSPTSHYLHGVRHLPWAMWPEGEHAVHRHAAFWQQDGEGRIVAAAASLAGVLRTERGRT